MQQWKFMIEQLTNGAWHVAWLEGSDDYGRLPGNRAGFQTYADAEKFVLKTLRDMMRKQRDKWSNEARLAASLKAKAAA